MPLPLQLNPSFCLRYTNEQDRAILGGGHDISINKGSSLKILTLLHIVCKGAHLCWSHDQHGQG